jgi:Uma2 family endonuclease
MNALAKLHFTPEEYLELETTAEYKSQYIAGEIFAMAGAQPVHVKVTGNILAALHNRFRGRPCDVFNSDMRVRSATGDMYTYPDVSALCGEPEFEGDKNEPPSLLNPQVIIEVLSRSTQDFDRGDKFARYRKIATLTDYVLVSTDEPRVEQYIRLPSGVWTRQDRGDVSGVIRLASLDCDLPLAEIYEKVAFTV